jgi:hypothetical protein
MQLRDMQDIGGCRAIVTLPQFIVKREFEFE